MADYNEQTASYHVREPDADALRAADLAERAMEYMGILRPGSDEEFTKAQQASYDRLFAQFLAEGAGSAGLSADS